MTKSLTKSEYFKYVKQFTKIIAELGGTNILIDRKEIKLFKEEDCLFDNKIIISFVIRNEVMSATIHKGIAFLQVGFINERLPN
jgi:hypothetical protein